MTHKSSIVEGVFAMSQTIGLTKLTLLTYILPPFVCLYLMGILVQLDGMRTYRMALLFVTVCLAWRATFVDISGGDLTKNQLNTTLITQMCIVVTRSIVWAFARVQYRRHDPVGKRDKSNPATIYAVCWNTWDLMLNARGIGWNWSRGLVVPKPIFETDSRIAFVLSMLVGAVFDAVGLDACVQIIRILSPETFGSLKGGSLFDGTLPLVLEFSRAILVTFLTAASVYFVLQHSYKLLAIVCVTLFRYHPSQWPPLFDTPWLSTSLNELWGRRWHQLMRDSVLNLGFRPFSCMFGQLGGLLGAFLISGIFHDFDLGQHGHARACLSFWVMNGVGVVLERFWKKATGRLVRGIWGWLWGAGWLFLWGVPMADAYARVGRLGTMGVIGGFEPSLVLVALVRRLCSSV